MNQLSSLLLGLNYVKAASECFKDVIRQSPGTVGAAISEKYSTKTDWIMKDIITSTLLPKEFIDNIKKEFESDSFAVTEIASKAVLLSDANRQSLDLFLDELLSGKELVVEAK